jgi:hypothetical protein
MATTNDTASRYVLHAILPAMHIAEPLKCGPVVFCTTRHLDKYPIALAQVARGVEQVTRQFRDMHGKPLHCLGLALVSSSTVSQAARESLPRLCRDAVALCHITRGTDLNCHHSQRTTVANSDYFDALPIYFKDHGLVIQRPGLLAFGWRVSEFRPRLPPHLGYPREDEFQIDELLFSAFDRAASMLQRGRKLRSLRQVFRAVALTMHATRILPESNAIVYDLAPRIASWIAAFETLVHPGRGTVGFDQVRSLIERIHWCDKRPNPTLARLPRRGSLNDRRYAVSWRGQRLRVNAACWLYKRLYDLRNALAHGNAFRGREFAARPGQRRGPRIDEVAPLLFRECLLERFRELGVLRRFPSGAMSPRSFGDYVRYRMNATGYHQALSKTLLARSFRP